MYSVIITPKDVEMLRSWLANDGGIAVWESVDLSNPGLHWYTPARHKDGSATPKPSWRSASLPAEIVTDPAQVAVVQREECARIRIATRVSGNGLMVKLTPASSQRLTAQLEIWRSRVDPILADHVTYHFDGKEAIIEKPVRLVPLPEWA